MIADRYSEPLPAGAPTAVKSGDHRHDWCGMVLRPSARCGASVPPACAEFIVECHQVIPTGVWALDGVSQGATAVWFPEEPLESTRWEWERR